MSRKSKVSEFIEEGYTLNVLGRNVLVTDAMKDYALEKIAKIDKLNNRIIDINITMDIQKLVHRVDIIMKVDHVKIKSSAASEDMYASIDIATDKLQKQLLKYKKRIQEHTAKPLSDIDMNVNVINVVNSDLAEFNDEIEAENRRKLIESYQPHKVVERKTSPLKLLHTDEAVMKLDLSGDNFLIYRSEEDRKLKVMYRRNDGNFAVIEIES